jgi:hypothetical protein
MCFFYLELLLTWREVGEQGRGIGLGKVRGLGDADSPAEGKMDGEHELWRRSSGCGLSDEVARRDGEQGRERRACEREGAWVGSEERAQAGFYRARGERRGQAGEGENDRPSTPLMAAANNSAVTGLKEREVEERERGKRRDGFQFGETDGRGRRGADAGAAACMGPCGGAGRRRRRGATGGPHWSVRERGGMGARG